jgi:hypothetical protein
LELLVGTRLADLSVISKAHLLDAIQKMKLAAHPKSEAFVEHIIKSVRADDLSELKSLTDSKV